MLIDTVYDLQAESTRRRDAEFQKLHRELEESQAQNEAQVTAFRKKHQEAVNQLTEQLDQLHKVKQKYSDIYIYIDIFQSVILV